MPSHNDSEEILSAVRDLFQAAEDDIKKVERTSREIPIPAVNELRYAGHHLLKGLGASTPMEREEQYHRARRHCQRARHDAVEVRLWYFLGKFKEFQDDYQTVSIPPVWPDYVDDAQCFDAAMTSITTVAARL
ncbi:MAG: hypothetical protein HQL82_06720 [Magnetococcales bacterium]|nr:hypothetical protein [Magnetococcales bacterium]